MSPSSLRKKLKPAKRVWRSFTDKLHSKLHNLKIPQTIKATSNRLLRLFFLPFKRRFLTKPPYPRHYHHQYEKPYNQYQNQHHKNFAAIFIDQLYAEPFSSMHFNGQEAAGTSRGKQVIDDDYHKVNFRKKDKEKSTLYSIEDAWNVVVASSPHLRGVDERADDFIHKFREEMRIEKERSILEFQEMLARSA